MCKKLVILLVLIMFCVLHGIWRNSIDNDQTRLAFGMVHLGMPREQVERILGSPTFSFAGTLGSSAVWEKHGNTIRIRYGFDGDASVVSGEFDSKSGTRLELGERTFVGKLISGRRGNWVRPVQ